MIAAIEGHHEAVELLLNQGAKFDLCDKDDRSALFHAANKNEVNVLKVSQYDFREINFTKIFVKMNYQPYLLVLIVLRIKTVPAFSAAFAEAHSPSG